MGCTGCCVLMRLMTHCEEEDRQSFQTPQKEKKKEKKKKKKKEKKKKNTSRDGGLENRTEALSQTHES